MSDGNIDASLRGYRLGLVGRVTPPADMIGAARQSLPAHKFDEMMRLTDGKPPTPAQLCEMADALNAQ